MWALRRGFWNFVTTSKYRASRPAVIPVPRDASRPIVAVGLGSLYPAIPIPNIRVADHVPDDEASWVKSRFYDFQVALYRWFSPMQAGLPSIGPDPQKALAGAYTAAHRRCFPAPVLPPEYLGAVDLGSLAVAGPYACFVERAPDGGYQWDLAQLARYEHHDGLRPARLVGRRQGPVSVRQRAREEARARRAAQHRVEDDHRADPPAPPPRERRHEEQGRARRQQRQHAGDMGRAQVVFQELQHLRMPRRTAA